MNRKHPTGTERTSLNYECGWKGGDRGGSVQVIHPIYKSHYERGDGLTADDPDKTARYRDHVIYWAKDLGRTIDCLETHRDLKLDKLAITEGRFDRFWRRSRLTAAPLRDPIVSYGKL